MTQLSCNHGVGFTLRRETTYSQASVAFHSVPSTFHDAECNQGRFPCES